MSERLGCSCFVGSGYNLVYKPKCCTSSIKLKLSGYIIKFSMTGFVPSYCLSYFLIGKTKVSKLLSLLLFFLLLKPWLTLGPVRGHGIARPDSELGEMGNLDCCSRDSGDVIEKGQAPVSSFRRSKNKSSVEEANEVLRRRKMPEENYLWKYEKSPE